MILFSVGYRAFKQREQLISRLKESEVSLVLDCREKAWGIPQYRGPELKSALRSAEIIYEHRDDFGNPYRPPQYQGPEALRLFEKLAERERFGDRLVIVLRRGMEWRYRRVALLCACVDADRCHRGILCRLAAKSAISTFGKTIEVRHICPRPKTEDQQKFFSFEAQNEIAIREAE